MQNIFGFIISPMEVGLIWLVSTVGSAGIGIILFTILVRLLLSPLQILQLRNAKAMQRLAPHLAEIRKKHGSDRAAASQATMELYKQHNLNPAMGCLPTLLQFPILIGLFYALMHLGETPNGYPGAASIAAAKNVCNGQAVHSFTAWLHSCYQLPYVPSTPQHIFELFHADFLWLSHGLGRPDPLYILPILAGVAQWVQSRMMLTRSVDPQQQMMNTMTNFFPLMIVFFALRYPSGLSLYWVTSTLIGIAIQYRITGLGLLTDTLSSGPVAALLGRGTAPAPSPTKKSTAPRRATPPVSSSDAPIPPAEMNGTNGSTPENSNGSSTPQRPRKRSNRPKGGRGGGRRG